MAIDPLASGRPSAAHVSLHEAGTLARGARAAEQLSTPGVRQPTTTKPRGQSSQSAMSRRSVAGPGRNRSFVPHTPITANAGASPDQWDAMLNRLGNKHNVPPLFLKAVMLSESGGRPDAIGDGGHSVGLFQLHDQGYGAGMGDRRFDPEANADRAARGLAEAWHAGERAGFTGEFAVRAAYNYSFNPGGGWAYQGDSVVRHYNQLLAEQRLPPLR